MPLIFVGGFDESSALPIKNYVRRMCDCKQRRRPTHNAAASRAAFGDQRPSGLRTPTQASRTC